MELDEKLHRAAVLMKEAMRRIEDNGEKNWRTEPCAYDCPCIVVRSPEGEPILHDEYVADASNSAFADYVALMQPRLAIAILQILADLDSHTVDEAAEKLADAILNIRGDRQNGPDGD